MEKKYEEVGSQSVPSADYRQVEDTLTNLWKTAAEGREGKGALTRICVLNMVVFAEEESIREKAGFLVEAITGHPPLRVIFVQMDHDTDRDYLDAYVSVSCRLPTEGEKQLCCENITLTAGGKGVEKVSHGLLPLLEPDLPVFLFWPGDLSAENEEFCRMVEICDRLIIDSGDFRDSGEALYSLGNWVGENKEKTVISDLNWARLTPCREWVAEFFDPQPNRRYIPAINRVIFEFTGKKEDAKTAVPYLLLGWLASVLDWGLVAREEHRFTFRKINGGVSVEAEMRFLNLSAEDGNTLASLTIASDSPAMKLNISFQKEQTCVFWSSESQGRGGKCGEISWKIPDEARLLSEELQILRRDQVYENSLAASLYLKHG